MQLKPDHRRAVAEAPGDTNQPRSRHPLPAHLTRPVADQGYAQAQGQPRTSSVANRAASRESSIPSRARLSPPELRRHCARWLTWRRMRLGLTCELMACYLCVPRRTLLLLEFGALDATTVHPSIYSHLSYILAGVDESPSWVAAILDAALGNVATLPEIIVRQILTDLDSGLHDTARA